jgi:hypothetical protein
MPYRAAKPAGRLIPRRLSVKFPTGGNPLRVMSPVGNLTSREGFGKSAERNDRNNTSSTENSTFVRACPTIQPVIP